MPNASIVTDRGSEVHAEIHAFEAPLLLSELLERVGAHLAKPCGGRGTCGKCRVRAEGALEPFNASGSYLACQTRATGDVTITLPSAAGERVITQGDLPPITLAPWGERRGVAIDIGTTTVAAYLYDLCSGERLGCASAANPQGAFGADVITRMDKAEAGQGEALREAITGCVRGLIGTLCAEAPADCAVITGNTAMLYLLCGHLPSAIMRVPFTMDQRFGRWIDPLPFGLPARAKVYLPDCISAYLGADITTALLASGLYADGRIAECPPTLLADIGTNGEIVLCAHGKLYACATAAGPAFEGAGISQGMTARDGAIAHLTQGGTDTSADISADISAGISSGISSGISMEVIGGGEASGICGSGIVDALALMLDRGALDETGALEEDDAYRIPGTQVEISQADVRAIQLAKAAIHAGMLTLIHEARLKPSQVERLLIAGGFGSCIDPASAERIGLIPEGFAGKARAIGNAAGMGASMALLSAASLEDTRGAAACCQIVELATNPCFMNAYVECMMFPEA